MTAMYNVVEKVRSGCALSGSERDMCTNRPRAEHRATYTTSLMSFVAEAYGWQPDASAAAILDHPVALHEERLEESEGSVRWLRSTYQSKRFGKQLCCVPEVVTHLRVTREAPCPCRSSQRADE